MRLQVCLLGVGCSYRRILHHSRHRHLSKGLRTWCDLRPPPLLAHVHAARNTVFRLECNDIDPRVPNKLPASIQSSLGDLSFSFSSAYGLL